MSSLTTRPRSWSARAAASAAASPPRSPRPAPRWSPWPAPASALARSPTTPAHPPGDRRRHRPPVAASLLESYEPEVVVLVAGATPHMLPLQDQTWETFSVHWETDVRITFQWLRQALLTPLRSGSRFS